MKVLFVIRDMFLGGAGKQLSLTASSLIDKGHEVTLYTYMGNTMEHNIDPRICYVAEKNTPKSKLTEYLYTPGNIRRVVKEINPDIVISWRANSGCFTVLACIGLNVKVVFSERSDPYMETSPLLKIATFICQFSDGGVFQTREAQRYYKRLVNKSIVIPNPVILDEILPDYIPLNGRNHNIVWIGRIKEPQKRLDVLLKAFQIVHKEKPNINLSIFGDGPDMDSTKSLAKDLGISSHVIFQGRTDKSIEAIKSYSLLVLSSDYEGIPNVIIEAFIAGVPVVATDCSPGGARVLVDDEVNGYIVPAGNFNALAHRICDIIDNPALAEEFIKKGRKKLHCFDSKTIFHKWNEYIIAVTKKENDFN